MLKGQTCFTGRDGSYQEILKGVELDIVDEDDCQKQLRTTRLGEDFILDRSFLCAGGKPNKDACKGKQKSMLYISTSVCVLGTPTFVEISLFSVFITFLQYLDTQMTIMMLKITYFCLIPEHTKKLVQNFKNDYIIHGSTSF